MKRLTYPRAFLFCVCIVSFLSAAIYLVTVYQPRSGDNWDDNYLYKKNYDPKKDDEGGFPLSSLIPCPVVASLYNTGFFENSSRPSFKYFSSLVNNASFELKNKPWLSGEFDWGMYPEHLKLYELFISNEDIRYIFETWFRFEPDAAVTAAGLLGRSQNSNGTQGSYPFQLYNDNNMHGHSSEIRFDPIRKIGGFREFRCKAWWESMAPFREKEGYLCNGEFLTLIKNTNQTEQGITRTVMQIRVGAAVGYFLIYINSQVNGCVEQEIFSKLYQGKWPKNSNDEIAVRNPTTRTTLRILLFFFLASMINTYQYTFTILGLTLVNILIFRAVMN